MKRGVPGVPNGILSCPVLPMPLALVTFGGSPISASRTVVVSVFFTIFYSCNEKLGPEFKFPAKFEMAFNMKS